MGLLCLDLWWVVDGFMADFDVFVVVIRGNHWSTMGL